MIPTFIKVSKTGDVYFIAHFRVVYQIYVDETGTFYTFGFKNLFAVEMIIMMSAYDFEELVEIFERAEDAQTEAKRILYEFAESTLSPEEWESLKKRVMKK